MRTRPKAVSTSGRVLPFSKDMREFWSGTCAAIESRLITLAVKNQRLHRNRKFENRPLVS
jgi:hypothetical protein